MTFRNRASVVFVDNASIFFRLVGVLVFFKFRLLMHRIRYILMIHTGVCFDVVPGKIKLRINVCVDIFVVV